MALIYQGMDSVVFIFVFTLPNLVHIVGLIKCLLNEKMNHQQTLIGRLLCDLHGLSLFLPVAYSAYSAQGLFKVLTFESCLRMRTVIVIVLYLFMSVFYEKHSITISYLCWGCKRENRSQSALNVIFDVFPMKHFVYMPVFWKWLLIDVGCWWCYYNCYQLLPRLEHSDHWVKASFLHSDVYYYGWYWLFHFHLCPPLPLIALIGMLPHFLSTPSWAPISFPFLYTWSLLSHAKFLNVRQRMHLNQPLQHPLLVNFLRLWTKCHVQMQIQEEQSLFVALSSRSMRIYIFHDRQGAMWSGMGKQNECRSKALMVCFYGGSIP